MVILNTKKKQILELMNINEDSIQDKNESISRLMGAIGECGMDSLMGKDGCSK